MINIKVILLSLFYIIFWNSVSANEECILIKLSTGSKYSIVTSRSDYHVKLFAAAAKESPIIYNRTYSKYSVAFLYSKATEQLANKLDINNDYIISLEELFILY